MQRDIPDGDVVQTISETAQQLGVTKPTLWRWRRRADRNGLPYVQLSESRVGYLRRDVRAFLVARRVIEVPGQSALGQGSP